MARAETDKKQSNESHDLLAQMDMAIRKGDSSSLARAERLAEQLQQNIKQRQLWIVVERLHALFREFPWVKSISMELNRASIRRVVRAPNADGVEIDEAALADFMSQASGGEAAQRVRQGLQSRGGADPLTAKYLIGAEFEKEEGWGRVNWPTGPNGPPPLRIVGASRGDVARSVLDGENFALWEAQNMRQVIAEQQTDVPAPTSELSESDRQKRERPKKESPRL